MTRPRLTRWQIARDLLFYVALVIGCCAVVGLAVWAYPVAATVITAGLILLVACALWFGRTDDWRAAGRRYTHMGDE